MVHYVVQINLDAPVVGFRNQTVEVAFCAELRIDFGVVCDVISMIRHTGVDGREPKGFHAQLVEIVQLLGDAIQVSISVSVAVGEGIDQ